MAESEREPTNYVQLKVRCRERLRAQLEAEAQEANHSLNNEIVRRLERSFSDDAREKSDAEMKGGWKTTRLCAEVVKAIQFFGVDCDPSEEPLMREVLSGALTAILNERLSGWAGSMGTPAAEPRNPDTLVEAPLEIARKGRARGAVIGHHITLATRVSEQEAGRLASPPSSVEGETLLQAAARLGLMAPGSDEPSDTARETTKKDKKASN